MKKQVDLRFATNMFGKVDKKIQKRIEAYLKHPDFEGWNDIYSIIINWGSVGASMIWQAVIAIDPTFPKTGRVENQQGRILKDWERIPTAEQVKEAIFYATH